MSYMSPKVTSQQIEHCIVLTAKKFCIWHVCKPRIHLHLHLSVELCLHFLIPVTLWADLPPNSSRSVSGPFPIHHGSRDHFSLCVYFHWLCWVVYLIRCSSSSPDPSVADTQGFYFCWIHKLSTEHTQSQTLKQRLKETNQSKSTLLLILRLGTLTFCLFVAKVPAFTIYYYYSGPTLVQMLIGQKYIITGTGVIFFLLLFIMVQNKQSSHVNLNCLLPGFHYLAEELELLIEPIQLWNDVKRVNSLFLRR